MKHGSLESGIGMFDYAAEQMNWDNVFHNEINPFCRTVLDYYWPKAKSYANVFGFNGHDWRGKVDVISAGFPCQPFSNAGKREGTKDDRHIWPENMRIFREAQPTFIVCENVPGLLTIENGVVFEQVCLDLEAEGYEVQTFIIPACATDKDHRRDRLWIVAYNSSFRGLQYRGTIHNDQRNNKKQECGREQQPNGFAGSYEQQACLITNHSEQGLPQPGQTREQQLQTETGAGLHNRFEQCDRDDTNTDNQRLQRGQCEQSRYSAPIGRFDRQFENVANTGSKRQQGQGEYRGRLHTEANRDRQINRVINGNQFKETWLEAATRLCSVDDGSAGELDTLTISKSKWRTASLKAYGNTIVWEIAYNIFQAIDQTQLIF